MYLQTNYFCHATNGKDSRSWLETREAGVTTMVLPTIKNIIFFKLVSTVTQNFTLQYPN